VKNVIVPYLPTDTTILSSNGKFIIKEGKEGYELWKVEPHKRLNVCSNINDFRKEIGDVYKIS
jgi:hypothetical protein